MNTSRSQYDYDVAIIGGGSGGYAAAQTAVDRGLRTAVIEGGKEIGGLCVLRGCMPTKTLLYSAEVAHLARNAAIFGVQANDVSVNLAQVMARKNALIKDFADFRKQQLAEGKFKFIRALARFKDPHSLVLSTGETITSRSFVRPFGRQLEGLPVSGAIRDALRAPAGNPREQSRCRFHPRDRGSS
jgi:pyruvate/2-oxoglutarate dehydrogenase complex dihydrolipoamide dehydrogenase (E3) component